MLIGSGKRVSSQIPALVEFALEAHKHSCLRQSRAKTASSSVPDKHSNYGAQEIP